MLRSAKEQECGRRLPLGAEPGAWMDGWMAKNQIENIWGLHENNVHAAFVGYQGLHCDGQMRMETFQLSDKDTVDRLVSFLRNRRIPPLVAEKHQKMFLEVFIYQTFPSGPICRPPWRPDQKVFDSLANKSKWDKSRLPHWNPQLTLTFHIFHSFHQSIFVQQHNWHICWLSKLSPFISKIQEEVTQLSS